jgi:hypothetical protein
VRLELLAACVLSLIVHMGIFWFAPIPALPSLYHAESPEEVELVTVDIPEPSGVPLPSAPPSSPAQVETALLPQAAAEVLPQVGSELPPLVATYDTAQISALDMQQINSTIEKMRTDVSAQLALPPIQLPDQRKT